MNAIVYKLQEDPDRQILESIAKSLHNSQFDLAETQLLEYIEDITTREFNTFDEVHPVLKTVNTLYSTFNIFYRSQYGDPSDLKKEGHGNILIARCSDPESMDDLLYEVKSYLDNFETDSDFADDEAAYHLECYKNRFHR
jgi:adenosine deaminase